MNLTAAFVEYLVTGCTALLWILYIILSIPAQPPAGIPEWTGILLLPVLYAVGMLIDFATYYPLRRLAKNIRQQVEEESKLKVTSAEPMTIAIIAADHELGREVILRSSRARIARGTALNLLILAFALFVCAVAGWGPAVPIVCFIASPILALLAYLALRAWSRFEYLAQRFKYNAYKYLEKDGKIKRLVTEQGQGD